MTTCLTFSFLKQMTICVWLILFFFFSFKSNDGVLHFAVCYLGYKIKSLRLGNLDAILLLSGSPK
jgi:hypothetical protein